MAGLPNAAPSGEPIVTAPTGTGQTPTAGATPAPTWYSDFKDADLKGYAELKSLKTAEDSVRYARDTEKFVGVPKDQLLRLPAKLDEAKPEELDAVYTRLGRPAAPTDYKLPTVEGGEEFAGKMAPLLHSAGLNQRQVDIVANGWNAYMGEAVKAQETAQQQRETLDLQNLHREWPGEVFPQREEMGRRAVSNFVTPIVGAEHAPEILGKMEDALGTATFLKLFSNIGEKLGESKFVGSERSSSFGVTPAAAKARLDELKGDREWGGKILNNPKGPEAQEWNRLIEIASRG